jgi:G3E family GTPase
MDFRNDIMFNLDAIDSNAPLIIFFGGTDSGKTAVILSLLRYLSRQGWSISVNENFRNDVEYNQVVKNIQDNLASPVPILRGTRRDIDAALINARYNNRLIFQIIEIGGESYVSTQDGDTASFNMPAGLRLLFDRQDTNLRKLLVFMPDASSKSNEQRKHEESNIMKTYMMSDFFRSCKQIIPLVNNKRDSTLILISKVDLPEFTSLKVNGEIVEENIIARLLAMDFKYKELKSLLKESCIDFQGLVTYSSGHVQEDKLYEPDSRYAKRLFSIIMRFAENPFDPFFFLKKLFSIWNRSDKHVTPNIKSTAG